MELFLVFEERLTTASYACSGSSVDSTQLVAGAAEGKRESLDVRIRAPLRFLWSFQSGRLCTRRALFGLARLQGTERAMMAYDNAPFHVQSMPRSLMDMWFGGCEGPPNTSSFDKCLRATLNPPGSRREFGMDVPRYMYGV
jgi:hypothetical protein